MNKLMLTVLCCALLGGTTARADRPADRLGLGARLGWQKLAGGDHDYSNLDQHFGLSLRRDVSPRWSLVADLTYGWNRPGALRGQDAGLHGGSVHAFYTTMLNTTVGARYHFNPAARFVPWVGGQAGLMGWKVRDENGRDFGKLPDGPAVVGFGRRGLPAYLEAVNAVLGLGLGAEYFLSPRVGVELGLNYTRIIGLDRDNIGSSALWGEVERDVNNGRWDIFLGITRYFGGDKDRDRDGIENARDGCPDAAEDYDGFRDGDGCPDPDNDADGVLDAVDACPDVPEDRDGFADDDGCPDPDNDGDGVVDDYDLCPDDAEDFDGFADEDGCPDMDNDADGVPDAQDQCPGTPSGLSVGANGCPEIAEISGALILDGVTFRPGSDELMSSSFAALDRVVASLLAYPEVTVEIQGHTDSVGETAYNLNMSRRRADTVRNYLMGRGVAPERLTAVGYGEAVPVADNSTPEGRAANRRVALLRTN